MTERRKQVDVSEEHHDLLHRIARRRGESLSQVVHEAIGLFLTEVVPDPDEAEAADADESSEGASGSARDEPAAPSQ